MAAERVARFEDLNVYRLAFELQQDVFERSKIWPGDERYSLTDHVRRSARAIAANVAEAWAKRRYVAHFVSKLTDADGEQNETRHWLKTAQACGYLEIEAYHSLEQKCSRIGAMLGRMMADAESWTK